MRFAENLVAALILERGDDEIEIFYLDPFISINNTLVSQAAAGSPGHWSSTTFRTFNVFLPEDIEKLSLYLKEKCLEKYVVIEYNALKNKDLHETYNLSEMRPSDALSLDQ